MKSTILLASLLFFGFASCSLKTWSYKTAMINIPGAVSDQAGNNNSYVMIENYPVGGIVSASISLLGKDGKPFVRENLYLHHVVIYSTENEDYICPASYDRYMAFGGDMSPFKFPAGYALITKGGGGWALSWDIMRYNGASPVDAFITLTITYNDDTSSYLPLTSVWLDVTGPCGKSSYDVAPGIGYATKKQVFNTHLKANGTMVYMIGHLHSGGTTLKFNQTVGDGTTMNKLVCQSNPTFNANGWITSMSSCIPMWPWKGQQEYLLESIYDRNPTETLEGVMGIFLSYAHLPNGA